MVISAIMLGFHRRPRPFVYPEQYINEFKGQLEQALLILPDLDDSL